MSFVLLIEFFFLKEKNFFRLGLFSRSYECFMDYSQRTLYIVLQCFAVLELLLHIGKFFHLLWICQYVFMGFRMSIHFQNMILFRNVFSFSKCERCHECFFFLFHIIHRELVLQCFADLLWICQYVFMLVQWRNYK